MAGAASWSWPATSSGCRREINVELLILRETLLHIRRGNLKRECAVGRVLRIERIFRRVAGHCFQRHKGRCGTLQDSANLKFHPHDSTIIFHMCAWPVGQHVAETISAHPEALPTAVDCCWSIQDLLYLLPLRGHAVRPAVRRR